MPREERCFEARGETVPVVRTRSGTRRARGVQSWVMWGARPIS